MKTLLLVNTCLVNEGTRRSADVLIKNGRIEKIASSLTNEEADQVIDAEGKILLPGMMDCHTHCREPGLEEKATLHSETRAAVAGGVTSIMDMPNTKPAATTNALLEEKFALAQERCLTNYSFYLGASNSNLDELLAVNPKTVCGIKLFMGASTGNLLVDRKEALEQIFAQVRIPLAVHCEDSSLIDANLKQIKARFGNDIPFRFHSIIRSAEACCDSTAKAIELAKRHDTQLHVLHVTTACELDFFEIKGVAGKKITAEACPHHLWFSEADYEEKKAFIKCNPSIKTADDRAALRQALLDGRLDTVGTDHAPHLFSEKQNPYISAPSGMPNIQSALPVLMEFLSPELIAEKTAHNPATIFNIKERGFIREGYWADLALIDPVTPHTVEKENIEYKCGWSPFEGTTFQSTVCATIVSGQLAYLNGQINDSVRGKRLLFSR